MQVIISGLFRQLEPEKASTSTAEINKNAESKEEPKNLLKLSDLDSVTAETISEKSSAEKVRSMTSLSNLKRFESSPKFGGISENSVEKEENLTEEESFGDFEFAVTSTPASQKPISKIDELKNMTLNVTYEKAPDPHDKPSGFEGFAPTEKESLGNYISGENSIDLLADLDFTSEVKSDAEPALAQGNFDIIICGIIGVQK